MPSGKIKKATNVLYVSSLKKNLLSVGAIADKGVVSVFGKKRCLMICSQTRQILAGWSRDPRNGVYRLKAIHQVPVASSTEVNSIEDPEMTRLWHKRLAPLNHRDSFHFLASKNLVTGFPLLPLISEVCQGCQFGKQPKERHPKVRSNRALSKPEIIHADLCGPFPVVSLSGAKILLSACWWLQSQGLGIFFEKQIWSLSKIHELQEHHWKRNQHED